MARSQPAIPRKTKPVTVGTLVDSLHTVRKELRLQNKVTSEIESRKTELQDQLIALMEEQGLAKATGTKASATMGELIMPQIIDFDKFWAFMKRTNAGYLLERRPAAAPYRELLASRNGKPVPGLASFPKKTLNLRSL